MLGKPVKTILATYLYTRNYQQGITGSIVVVVTPLISLMIDQKEKFVQRGLRVEFVGEAQKEKNATTVVLNGDIQLVYISPESLLLNCKYTVVC